jgi:hypothetical protein
MTPTSKFAGFFFSPERPLVCQSIVYRGSTMLMFKAVEVDPLPKSARDPAARWDAYIHVPDPDALAAEFTSRGVLFSVPLKDTTTACVDSN